MLYLLDNAHANYLIFLFPSHWFIKCSIPFMAQALICLLRLFYRSSNCKTLNIPCPVCFLPPHAKSAGRPLSAPAVLIPDRVRSPSPDGHPCSAPAAPWPAVLVRPPSRPSLFRVGPDAYEPPAAGRPPLFPATYDPPAAAGCVRPSCDKPSLFASRRGRSYFAAGSGRPCTIPPLRPVAYDPPAASRPHSPLAAAVNLLHLMPPTAGPRPLLPLAPLPDTHLKRSEVVLLFCAAPETTPCFLRARLEEEK